MRARARFWTWLGKAKTQKALAFIGSGLTALAIAVWQVYLHFAAPPPSHKSDHNITASQNGIAVSGNMSATAAAGGTAIVATGGVIIGITLEQHEESIRRREREIREELARSNAADKKRIAVLEKQLADAQGKLQDSSGDLQKYKTKIVDAITALDELSWAFTVEELDQARRDLAKGDTVAAERLFSQILAAGKNGAAMAAYQLGVLSESRLRYAEASQYYTQAATLEPGNPFYLHAAGRMRVSLYRDHFLKTFDSTAFAPELERAADQLSDSARQFDRAGDDGRAALSLIDLGEVRRLQNRHADAIEFFKRGFNLAKKAGDATSQTLALIGQGRSEMEGRKDFAAAAAHFQEAVTISEALTDRTRFFNALSYVAQAKLATGDAVAAAEMLNRALSVAPEVKDQSLLLFVYIDRADVFEKLAERAGATKVVPAQLENFKLAQADYEEAQRIAQKYGYAGISSQIEQFLRHLALRRQMVESN